MKLCQKYSKQFQRSYQYYLMGEDVVIHQNLIKR